MNRYSSGSIIGWIIGIILFCIFEPVIYFGLAYFGGWIMQMCIGRGWNYSRDSEL